MTFQNLKAGLTHMSAVDPEYWLGCVLNLEHTPFYPHFGELYCDLCSGEIDDPGSFWVTTVYKDKCVQFIPGTYRAGCCEPARTRWKIVQTVCEAILSCSKGPE